MSLLLASAVLALLGVPAQQAPTPRLAVRACADSWNDSGANPKKNKAKNSKKEMHAASGACVELDFSALEIQEFLQAHARDEQWKIGGDQMMEDSWTFSLEMGKEEILRYTTEDSRDSKVEWKAGTARVHVNTAKLADGYTRTIIRASFRGYGRSEDQFAPHKEYWELDSNNNFENSLVSAIKTHFGTATPEGPPHARSGLKIPWTAAVLSNGGMAPAISN